LDSKKPHKGSTEKPLESTGNVNAVFTIEDGATSAAQQEAAENYAAIGNILSDMFSISQFNNISFLEFDFSMSPDENFSTECLIEHL